MPFVGHAAESDEQVGRPFAVVLEEILRGDLVMAANSNLVSAGGWSTATSSVADVDGDASLLCVRRAGTDAACADNSSSARLDVPPGAQIVHARLYVETSLSASAGPLRVRLDRPGARFDYTLLDADTAGVPKLYESSIAVSERAVLRQAVWDVTEHVAIDGAGRYTVADIVGERAGAFLPYASWAIVAAYELDPELDVRTLGAADRSRFTRRTIAWHDGFVRPSTDTLGMPVAELAIALADATFAKSFHIAAAARRDEPDNLLFNGQPLGNNLTPGDRPPPPGVVVVANRACNSTTDVFNETICVLGAPVASKKPGRAGYVASSDGATRSSGSAVDMDVVRVPDRYLLAGATSAEFTVNVTDAAPALGMVAVSVDLARPRS
jgi:hypothetical protein